MKWKTEWKPLAWLLGAFLLIYFLPIGHARFDQAITESLALAKWYAREHVLLCLVPAFFIAGAVSVFVSQAAVMKYLGAQAPKVLAYAVASVSGTILAVCSCTVLPLFAGIYRMGAGLGPATAFLYSGPAVNVLAIILTARVLGLQLGIARAVGAILFSVVIGFLMHLIFRREEAARSAAAAFPEVDAPRPLYQTSLYFASMVLLLVFANWGRPDEASGTWAMIYNLKWPLTGLSAAGLGVMLAAWMHVRWWKIAALAAAVLVAAWAAPQAPLLAFTIGVLGLTLISATGPEETQDWLSATWTFAKQILPLLLIGVLVAGFLLGRPGSEGLIASRWVTQLVGGNSIQANLFAAVAGAFMYFATLTEVPILQGLLGSGMGQGPALALLLAGPALSLPSMLVIRSVIGTKKTVVYVFLVVVMATLSGLMFGAMVGA